MLLFIFHPRLIYNLGFFHCLILFFYTFHSTLYAQRLYWQDEENCSDNKFFDSSRTKWFSNWVFGLLPIQRITFHFFFFTFKLLFSVGIHSQKNYSVEMMQRMSVWNFFFNLQSTFKFYLKPSQLKLTHFWTNKIMFNLWFPRIYLLKLPCLLLI